MKEVKEKPRVEEGVSPIGKPMYFAVCRAHRLSQGFYIRQNASDRLLAHLIADHNKVITVSDWAVNNVATNYYGFGRRRS